MKKENKIVRVTMRESRGDGDFVEVEIEDRDSIVVADGCIRIKGADGCFYIFPSHNVLYLKIYFLVDCFSNKTISGLPVLHEL